jgi:hypothetical protein
MTWPTHQVIYITSISTMTMTISKSMSNNQPDDSQQESEQEPADSDQPSAQSDEQPAEQTDQSTEQSEEQPAAESDEPADQAQEQPTESDQPADQSEEQPSDESDQPAEQSEEQPADSDQPEEQPTEGEQTAAEADEQPTDSAQPAGQASAQPTLSPAPKRPYGVESWRPLVTEMAGDIPVEVLLRWIKHESGGNPCSTGAPAKTGGGSIENGIFQLYSPDDDHLATPAQLHGSFCTGQTCTRDLTLEEARIQVASGIAYVRSCRERARAQLKQAGVTWDEKGTDFWSLVKMQHNLPSVPKQYIPKLRPSSWSEFKQGVLKEQPKYANTTIFTNAEDIGAAA